MMKKMKFGILMVVVVFALVSAVSATLPYNPVNVHMTFGGPNAYWSVDVAPPGVSPELPASNGMGGFCTDPNHGLGNGDYVFTAYSSLNEGSFPSGMPTANWKKVNYILNNEYAADWRITQAAIWHYDGMSAAEYPSATGVRPYDSVTNPSGYKLDDYKAYIHQVDLHGANFIPRCGEYYAIILYKPDLQEVIVRGQTDRCDNTPEFPTLALPVAMLIGVVGMAQYVRSKKE